MKIKLPSYKTWTCLNKKKKEKKKPESSNLQIIYLIKFASYINWFIYFQFSILKFPSYEKLAMMSQFDVTRLYDVIIHNSVF